MEVPGLGSNRSYRCYPTPQPQQLGIWASDLHHSSRQHWILNPLCKSRDLTSVFMDTSHTCHHWATTGTLTADNFILRYKLGCLLVTFNWRVCHINWLEFCRAWCNHHTPDLTFYFKTADSLATPSTLRRPGPCWESIMSLLVPLFLQRATHFHRGTELLLTIGSRFRVPTRQLTLHKCPQESPSLFLCQIVLLPWVGLQSVQLFVEIAFQKMANCFRNKTY